MPRVSSNAQPLLNSPNNATPVQKRPSHLRPSNRKMLIVGMLAVPVVGLAALTLTGGVAAPGAMVAKGVALALVAA